MYYVYNAHGDVVQLLNASGTVTKTYDYDAYGNELERDLNDSNPFRYCGEYYDTETGFIYLRARYYDPNTGRVISVDPAHDGLNWYIYCIDNPLNYLDPSGLSTERNGIVWYDTVDKAAYAFGVRYNGESIKNDTEIGTFIYSRVFYLYDGEYYSSIEMGRAYDRTESLRDYSKKFTPVILYCFDEDVAYGDRGYSIDGEYKYVNIVPKRRIGKIEAMIHTHGNATRGGEEFFSVAVVGQDGQVIDKQYNDSGVAYMYRTYGFNAFNSDNPKEIHGIKNFVSYIVTPRGELKKLTPKDFGIFDDITIDNPFDDYYYRIPAYND